ncbi:MAG: methyltransferase C-terminal domain-containing protein [Burkholderiaceae bacterium]
MAGYLPLGDQIRQTKRDFLSHLIQAKAQGRSIVAYGAPAKGNTLLNYAGVRGDFIDYAVDRSPHKQGRYLPGTQIPVLPPEQITRTKPDIVLILAWNLADEIESQMSGIRQWGGKFMTVIPQVKIW